MVEPSVWSRSAGPGAFQFVVEARRFLGRLHFHLLQCLEPGKRLCAEVLGQALLRFTDVRLQILLPEAVESFLPSPAGFVRGRATTGEGGVDIKVRAQYGTGIAQMALPGC